MSLLFETIRIKEGVLYNLDYHNHRMNQSRKQLFGSCDSIDLLNCINIPTVYNQGINKCKVVYGKQIEQVSFEPYLPREIQSLKLVDDNSVCYDHKYCNREQLIELSGKRVSCDDVLIVKNGYITDTSFSNIVFFDGTRWLTPLKPLLYGTMRSYLLMKGFILEKAITVIDLRHFQKARLINAMLPFHSDEEIEIGCIGY